MGPNDPVPGPMVGSSGGTRWWNPVARAGDQSSRSSVPDSLTAVIEQAVPSQPVSSDEGAIWSGSLDGV
jgi:hypothetical protein